MSIGSCITCASLTLTIVTPPQGPDAEHRAGPPPLGSVFFVDISDASGIRVDNVVRGSDVKIPINDHSRLGFVDIDGDGFDDVVCHSLYPNPRKGIPFEHLVYRNEGDGTFEHVSDASGLRSVQAGWMVFGDVDNDGDQDCFAGLDVPLSGETHRILLNDGKGHFSVKAGSGVEALAPYAGNAVFADFNGDARLDLFVGMGHTSYAAANALLFGKGDGTFVDRSAQLHGNRKQPTNGSVSCDYDGDGDLDILVSNYGVSVLGGQNALFENDGSGVFQDVGARVGFASLKTGNYWLDEAGRIDGDEPKPAAFGPIGCNGFGLDCGDVNNDGLIDVFLTAISHPNAGSHKRKWSDPSQLLIHHESDGAAHFVNEFRARGLPFNEGDVDGALVDFDNDGRLDLSISRDKKYERGYASIEQKAWFGLMHQQADGSFASVGPRSGINAIDPPDVRQGKNLLRMKNAQNHAWSDIDRDGDMDLLVGGRDTGGGRPNFLFRNDLGSRSPWLQLLLEGDGDEVDRDAIGTRVWVSTGDGPTQLREVKSSRGMHCSMDSRWLHFGLGQNADELVVRVRWCDGTEVTLPAEELCARAAYRLRYPAELRAFRHEER